MDRCRWSPTKVSSTTLWMGQERGICPPLLGPGGPVTVLVDQPLSKCQDTEHLIAALQKTFGHLKQMEAARDQFGEMWHKHGKTWGIFSMDLLDCTCRAGVIHIFIRVLSPEGPSFPDGSSKRRRVSWHHIRHKYLASSGVASSASRATRPLQPRMCFDFTPTWGLSMDTAWCQHLYVRGSND